jgi:hypothetical protein
MAGLSGRRLKQVRPEYKCKVLPIHHPLQWRYSYSFCYWAFEFCYCLQLLLHALIASASQGADILRLLSEICWLSFYACDFSNFLASV